MPLFDQPQVIHELLRAMYLAFAAFVVAMVLTPVYTHYAFKYKAWKQVRTHDVTGKEAPVFYKLHAAKHKGNLPTMAGVVTILAIVIVTVLFNFSRKDTYLPLFSLVAAGAVGLLDDYINIRGHKFGLKGLRARIKFLLIFLIATVGGLYFYFKLGYHLLHIPAFGTYSIGWLYIPLFIVVIVSTANAVNLTDGLDGLAGGLLALAFGAFGIICFFLNLPATAIFCATVVGAVLAYTWFNIFPARFLMGDTGAFALGTTLGVIAMLSNSVFVLPIIGAVFVMETGSSILQLASKRFRGKKIFLSSPIHHHFEAIGWPETKVTMRFWILGAIAAMVGVILALLGSG